MKQVQDRCKGSGWLWKRPYPELDPIQERWLGCPDCQVQDNGGAPKEAVEAVRERQGFKIGSHSWEGIRPTVERNLRAAAPAIRAQERERIREALEALPNHRVSPDTITEVFGGDHD